MNATELFRRTMASVTERAADEGLEEDVLAALYDVFDAAARRAELDGAGRTDAALVGEWERGLADEDRAVLAALAETDRLADLDR